jgi:hypothetical protein
MYRIPEEQQVAFKAEVPQLRKRLKAVQSARHKREPDLRALNSENEQCRIRLEYWHKIVAVEGTNKIRHPIRLWVVWNNLSMLANLNSQELEYLNSLE